MLRKRLLALFLLVLALALNALDVTHVSADINNVTNNNDKTVTPIANETMNEVFAGGSVAFTDQTLETSTINVSTSITTIADLNLTLTGFTHAGGFEAEVILQTPEGTYLSIYNSDCTDQPVNNVTWTFDDEASGIMPTSSCGSGTYLPAPGSYFMDDMTSLPNESNYRDNLSGADGENPNGVWTLYTFDVILNSYEGSISSWSLDISGPPPGVTTSITDANVDEGNLSDTATYTVQLDSSPTSAVVIDVSSDGNCTVTSPFSGTSGELTFTDTTAQTVTVVAIDDATPETSPHDCLITQTIDTTNTADANYDPVSVDNVTINVTDNDGATVTIIKDDTSDSGTAFDFTTDLGAVGSANFTLSDNGTPDSVTFSDIASGTYNISEAAEAGFYQASATCDNSDTPDSLTVTGGDNVTCTFVNSPLGVASAFIVFTDTLPEGDTNTSWAAGISFNPVFDTGSYTGTWTATPDSQCSVGNGAGVARTFSISPSPQQIVYVFAVEDTIVEGNHTCDITIDITTSTDPAYPVQTVGTVIFNITDNDSYGVTVTPIDSTVDESNLSDTATYDVQLDATPSGNVVIDVVTNGECTVTSPFSGTSGELTFIDTTPQTVTVIAVDDATPETSPHDCLITQTIDTTNTADANYDPLTVADITINVTDNDGATVTIIKDDTSDSDTVFNFTSDLNVTGSDNFSLQDPSGNSITFNSILPGTFTISETVAANFYQVSATCDNSDTPDSLTLAASDNVICTFTNSPLGGATLSQPLGTTFIEGNTSRVQIDFSPDLTGNVTVRYTPSGECDLGNGPGIDVSAGVSTPTNMTFRDVSVADNVIVDGTRTCTVDVDILTSDNPAYPAGAIGSVAFDISDNDAAGLVVTPTTLLVAEDAPGENSFAVSLAGAPTTAVTVNITFDASQLDLAPISLNFDDTNWNIPQNVSVDAINDGIDEGSSILYVIDVLASGDSAFAGLSDSVDVYVFDFAADIIGHVPNYGVILIPTSSPVKAAGSPSEGVAKNRDGSDIYLPSDYDGNGFDTYVVTDIRTYDGKIWLGLWMGNMNWLWVEWNPDTMSVISPLDWDMQEDWTP